MLQSLVLLLLFVSLSLTIVAGNEVEVHQHIHHHAHNGRRDILATLLESGRIYNGSTAIGSMLNYIELPARGPTEKCDLHELDNFNHPHPYKQCLRDHSLNELVSNIIHDTGAYGKGPKDGCNGLLYLWTIAATTSGGDHGIFLDVGGNIGTCSLLLAAVGAEVVAFEPMPPNYKVFVQSILANPTFKIKLYPYGAGDYEGSSLAFVQDNNMGNGVVGLQIPIKKSDSMTREDITIKQLDDVLWPSLKDPIEKRLPPPLIRVMKLDVQGYEYRALVGARALLECGAIKTIQWESEIHFLGKQNANPMMICEYLIKLNFRIASMDGVHYKDPQDCHPDNAGGLTDMQARLIAPVNATCHGLGAVI